MPIWGYLTLYAALLAVLTRLGGDRRGFWGLGVITLALIGVQFWKFAGIGDYQWIAFAATWSAVLFTLTRIIPPENLRTKISYLMLAFVVLCYLWGRVAGLPFSPSAPLVWADFFGVVAWTLISGPGVYGLVDRISGGRAMGRYPVRSGVSARGHSVQSQKQEARGQ